MSYQILVIDDMQSIFNSISEALKPRGCELDYAENGMTGLELAQTKLYDLILLDIHLPDRNGLAICSELKALKDYEHRPVLLITSDSKNLEEGLIVGASDYILKPFNKVELVARVFTQIKVSQTRFSLSKEKEQLENDLGTERQKLIEMENDLHKYFYQTSHRLRSPLNTIRGLFNLMKFDQPDLLESKYLNLIQKSVGRISQINEQVAKIGHLRSMVLRGNVFNLKEVVKKLITEKCAFDREIHLIIPDALEMETDKEVFLSGVEPILDNAIKYTSIHFKETGRIHVSTLVSNSSTYLIIQDNGPGISENYLDNVFDMFFIGDEYSQGNGLGLFISKIAFGMLHLNFRIQSSKGNYTRVIIDITHLTAKNENHENRRYSA